MTVAAASSPSESSTDSNGSPPAGWEALRADGNVQFAPVEIPPTPPPEPGWFEIMLSRLADFLAELFAPLGRALGDSWWWLQWLLVGMVGVFALVLLARLIDPGLFLSRKAGQNPAGEDEWTPDTAASLPLLEDADRLAADGRFDAATRLLLQRSVGQIAAVRPDWVEPSSTARELALLPALPDGARKAFAVMADRVERSLFALRALDRSDWDAARAAYAEFALARIDPRGGPPVRAA
ncbi:MAG: hypothetical protein GW768_12625 [Sphingomonadales bacterium]|nr:hypothetical protein [Sphingomonadales bacterium]NCT04774.1 hypothetical protein [Sphingomonadales bacterium]